MLISLKLRAPLDNFVHYLMKKNRDDPNSPKPLAIARLIWYKCDVIMADVEVSLVAERKLTSTSASINKRTMTLIACCG